MIFCTMCAGLFLIINESLKNVKDFGKMCKWANENDFLLQITCGWIFIVRSTNWKVFRCSSFTKMLPRCGRAAHICEANLFLRFGFPAAIAFLKPSNSNKVKWRESRLQIQTRQRGDCSMLVGKSRGGTPFSRTGKTVFSKKNKLFVYDSTSLGCAPALPNQIRGLF